MSAPQITLQGLAATSLLVSLVTAVFLPLRPLLRRFIGSRWLCMLWLALLARLLMPWPLETRWGVFNREQADTAHDATGAETIRFKVSFPKNGDLNESPSSIPMIARAAAATVAESHWDLREINFWNAAWLGGASLGLAMLGWGWVQTLRLGAKTRPAADARLRSIFEAIPKELRRNTRLRMMDAAHVPTLAGILRPQIWMPESWPGQFTDEELRNVLLHELGHARRGDLLVQWLFAIAQCIHWFNPLVWIAARAARFDREMACDAWVLARKETDSDGYGAALMKTVQLLRDPTHANPVTAAMASSRRTLYTRISGIGAFRPMPAWRGVAGTAMMIAALAAATTSRTPAQDAAKPGDKNAAIQPSALPDSAKGSRQCVNIQSKFVIITEETWKKLCAENPEFKEFAGKFPELNHKEETAADLARELKIVKDGAWQVPGEMQLLKMLTEEQREKIITAMNGTTGVDHLAAPSVTTRQGNRAVIEVVQEFRYPSAFKPSPQTPGGIEPTAFVTQNLGVTLNVTPSINNDKTIGLELEPTVAGFLGFMDEKGAAREFVRHNTTGLKPVFSISTLHTSTILPPTRTVLLGGVRIDNQETDRNDISDTATKWAGLPDVAPGGSWDAWEKGSPETVRHVLLVFVTADIAAPPIPAASSTPTAAQPSPAAPQDTKEGGVSSGPQIKIDSKLIQISEETWEKLCPPDAQPPPSPTGIGGGRNGSPAFNIEYLSPAFPQFKTEKPSYAELVREWTGNQNTPRQPAPSNMKLIGVLTGQQDQQMMKILDSTEGCKVLASPVVITRSGQKCEISSTLPLRYPSAHGPDKNSPTGVPAPEFATKDTGFTLQFQPVVEKLKGSDDLMDLHIACEYTALPGFLGPNNATFAPPNQNPIDGQKIASPAISDEKLKTDITIWDGQTVLLGSVQLEVGTDGKGNPRTERNVLLVALTAHIINGDTSGKASPSATPAPREQPADSKLPDAVPVPGKPGFVTSPYAPDQGMIDVQGYEKGTEVKDPYSGKIFLVP